MLYTSAIWHSFKVSALYKFCAIFLHFPYKSPYDSKIELLLLRIGLTKFFYAFFTLKNNIVIQKNQSITMCSPPPPPTHIKKQKMQIYIHLLGFQYQSAHIPPFNFPMISAYFEIVIAIHQENYYTTSAFFYFLTPYYDSEKKSNNFFFS